MGLVFANRYAREHELCEQTLNIFRTGKEQTLLQTLVLPLIILPALLPTPLLEPRYFLIPYILLRVQIVEVPTWAVIMEGLWYAVINWATMYIFLYAERPGVGRFMW